MAPRRLVIVLMVAFAAAFSGACGSGDGDAGASGSRAIVVATTAQVADFTRRVAGDRAEVRQIQQPKGSQGATYVGSLQANTRAGAGLQRRSRELWP